MAVAIATAVLQRAAVDFFDQFSEAGAYEMPSQIDPNIHDADPCVIEQNSTGYAVPKWFIVTASAVAATAGPWSAYITWAVIGLTGISADVESNSKRIDRLEDARENHALQLQTIAATRFTAVEARALNVGTETRLDRIDAKLESLQRDFDRSGISKRAME